MNEFWKFPHTPHLLWLGTGEARGDKVLSTQEVDKILSRKLIVEEKVDGANLGISVDSSGEFRFQNRGSYLEKPYRGQFSRLASWFSGHQYELVKSITPNLILFGEWCAAKHSLSYDRLNDWFLLFDVYSKVERAFWDTVRRDQFAYVTGLSTTPRVAEGFFDRNNLVSLLMSSESKFRHGSVEGLIIKAEANGFCEMRAKIVRPDFVQQINEHWSARRLEWNRVESDT
ncbi:RNA ligase family protein [Rhizobium rhizoryzae]|uniref:ATP-dependent RNA circularization protein (DNA/RNA ligase family) n=1 Tax=Rhizobium rhizoryzae TaxID=451876 RepID=A0A7W6LFD8_9HYPH|nr:RNA ligase family protein [Rhizobium rhizoryzae]MBB4143241.1 ATP-dependent RNA circularization protein (DNA/RNA ligase family) [Rhizobium rhizoryzae]